MLYRLFLISRTVDPAWRDRIGSGESLIESLVDLAFTVVFTALSGGALIFGLPEFPLARGRVHGVVECGVIFGSHRKPPFELETLAPSLSAKAAERGASV
ncbi:hypothetical protein FP2506_15794 [Fulvimarina pelagi HTCC2506]|uniref:Uncharacterized protein n=1 Tax=Fulvimarina pelagi HTCC2506 TaxID=314231 RepID=Q0G3C1_9HYPH|nr:hypothetical protein FP2506_15794 [Fulvimarina pelagi HTCC2506]